MNTDPNILSEPAQPMPDIGARLKAFRTEKGWSLARLSEITGISDATLSRVETGKSPITAHNLYALSKALEVDITAFYASETSPLRSGIRAISRQGQGHEISTDKFLTTVLAGDLSHKQMHPTINEITVTTLEGAGGLTGHSGEEFLFVLEGRLILQSAHYAPLLLEPGDSIYFDGSMPHAYLAGEGGRARVLVITTHQMQPPEGETP